MKNYNGCDNTTTLKKKSRDDDCGFRAFSDSESLDPLKPVVTVNLHSNTDRYDAEMYECPDCKGGRVHEAYIDEIRFNSSVARQCYYCCKCKTIWQHQFKIGS
ncbi:hypothetical protein KEC58_20680 (plasmid) [Photobacterium damselae]|uniref:hypothetical protein n=1 Tax=Photobacterium damselae TaxID=38293 RepID=UPI002543F10A